MADKVPTPGMPDTSTGKQRKGDGLTDGLMPRNTRGAGGGGPVGPKDAGEHGFHGGQSNAAYHGHGQLGERDVEGEDNVNAPSKDP